jgi:peptide/nickel transport system substrate-binding protein
MAAGSAAILAGCGDDDDDDAPASTGTAAGATTTAAGTGTVAANQPVRGGTLRNYKQAVDPGVDPAVYHLNNYEPVNLSYTQVMTYQVSKNLFAMDGMVKFEQVDPTTIVWTVRDGMKFHNGDPVTAEDWAYSMTRIPTITKERRGHTGTPLFNYIDSVVATDAKTAKMTLKRPNPSTTIHMARQYFAFINKKIIEASANKDVQDGPIGAGSGAYRIEKRDSSGTILVRNPDYFAHGPNDDGFNPSKDGPHIEKIQTTVLPDRAAQKAAFLAGDLDILGGMDLLERDEFKANKNLVVKENANGAISILAFDHKKLFDKRAREAIRKAINYDGLGASIYAGSYSYNAPVNVLLTAFQTLKEADIKAQYKYDPADAKKLWEAAGKPVSKIRILTGSVGQVGVNISDFAAQSLKQALGIDVEVQTTDPQTWAQRANRVPDKDWELLQSGTGLSGGTSGVPEDSHLIWFDPRAYGPLAFNSDPNSDNPAIKEETAKILEFMTKQETELDINKRKQILTDLQKYLWEISHTGAMMPIAAKQLWGYNARYQDFGSDDVTNTYALRRHISWLKPS